MMLRSKGHPSSHLARRLTEPVHLVVDGLPAHKMKLVKDYVASTDGMLALHFLLGYAPELNPDELVWSHETHRRFKKPSVQRRAVSGEDRGSTCRPQEAPRLLRSFFKVTTVAYIADW